MQIYANIHNKLLLKINLGKIYKNGIINCLKIQIIIRGEVNDT